MPSWCPPDRRCARSSVQAVPRPPRPDAGPRKPILSPAPHGGAGAPPWPFLSVLLPGSRISNWRRTVCFGKNVQPWSRTRAHARPGRDGGPAVLIVPSA